MHCKIIRIECPWPTSLKDPCVSAIGSSRHPNFQLESHIAAQEPVRKVHISNHPSWNRWPGCWSRLLRPWETPKQKAIPSTARVTRRTVVAARNSDEPTNTLASSGNDGKEITPCTIFSSELITDKDFLECMNLIQCSSELKRSVTSAVNLARWWRLCRCPGPSFGPRSRAFSYAERCRLVFPG